MPRTTEAQLGLTFRTWGGARRGAGRPPASAAAPQHHDARERFTRSQPVHITLRVRDHVWNLRSERSFRVIHDALARVRRRPDFSVVHFSVQGNHVHLLVEADGAPALANGMREVGIRIAKGLNHLMSCQGSVFEDRYHAHVLRSAAEARNALRYVLGNHESHARRRGESLPDGFIDRYSSAMARAPRMGQLSLWADPPTNAPETWLLRSAARV